MRVAALLLISSVAWADKPCPKLEPIGKLYDQYAAEIALAPSMELDLPQIDGKPEKLDDADLAKAPAPQPAQRWADLVKGKPVPLALPEVAAPPPPPPPPHR